MLEVIVVLIALGLIAYVVQAMPLEARIRSVLVYVIIAAAVLYVLQILGVCDVLRSTPVPRV